MAFKARRSCFLIADDLTGACDSGVAFALRGMSSTATWDLEETLLPKAHVLCLTTDSRGDQKTAARSKVLQAAQKFASHPTKGTLLFKKIDSCLRGNVVAETEAMMDAFGLKIALIAPSFPTMKRTVRQGILHVEGDSSATSIPLAEFFHREEKGRSLSLHDIPSHGGIEELKRVIREAQQDGISYLLADSESDQDLYELASAAACFRDELLLVGSGGLAQAAARVLQPESPEGISLFTHFQHPLIFLIGSNHPSTETQIEYLLDHSDVEFVSFESLEFPGIRRTARLALQEGVPLLLRIDRGKTTDAAIRTLWKMMGREQIGGLFLCGGDTATQVCRAVEATSISLKGEISTGIPWGILSNGIADGTPVITKSGGFGEKSCLSDIVVQCNRIKDVAYGS